MELDKKLEKIREMLTDRNISEVHRRTGISRPTLASIEKGRTKTIQLETFKKLVEYFGIE